jgi:hypothetical protein
MARSNADRGCFDGLPLVAKLPIFPESSSAHQDLVRIVLPVFCATATDAENRLWHEMLPGDFGGRVNPSYGFTNISAVRRLPVSWQHHLDGAPPEPESRDVRRSAQLPEKLH